MTNVERERKGELMLEEMLSTERPPKPTLHFRQKSWRDFQRALDPLAQPKPLKALRLH
jgi:hypothetical protein